MTTRRGKTFEEQVGEISAEALIWDSEAVQLLRAHHNRIRREIKKMADVCRPKGTHTNSGDCVGYRIACEAMLAMLDRLAGKKEKG